MNVNVFLSTTDTTHTAHTTDTTCDCRHTIYIVFIVPSRHNVCPYKLSF